MVRKPRGQHVVIGLPVRSDPDEVERQLEELEQEEAWEFAQKMQNDLDYWLYSAYRDKGLIDQATATKLMDFFHEEIRKKYEVKEEKLHG